MGLKVNILLVYCFIHGVLFCSFNIIALFTILFGFTIVYKNFKVWQFTGKFPGNNFTPNFKSLFNNSAESFHLQLQELYENHGKDKFITWIGFERYIAVSRAKDIQVSFNHGNRWPLTNRYDFGLNLLFDTNKTMNSYETMLRYLILLTSNVPRNLSRFHLN